MRMPRNLAIALNVLLAALLGAANLQADSFLTLPRSLVVEPVDGAAMVSVTARLDVPATETTRFSFATRNGSAIAGLDYVAKSGTLTFLPCMPSFKAKSTTAGMSVLTAMPA